MFLFFKHWLYTAYFLLSLQNYVTLHRAIMIDLKNVNVTIMSFNESDILNVIMYRINNFDSIINIRILAGTIKIFKAFERFDQPPLEVVRCITTIIFSSVSYNSNLIVYECKPSFLYCFGLYVYLYLFNV